jgi:hypothetical protein
MQSSARDAAMSSITPLCSSHRRRSRSPGTAATLLAAVAIACDGGLGPDDGPPAATIDVQSLSYGLIPGDTLHLTTVAEDAAGEPLTSKRFDWTVADPSVADIDDDGLITAFAPGTTTVRAAADGVEDSITLTVVEPTAACAAPGPVHIETVDDDETWTAAGGPHHVPADTLTVLATLTIEAGATICMGPNAVLEVGPGNRSPEMGLHALGSAGDSILFTPRQRETIWGGIYAQYLIEPESVTLSHVRLEHAVRGVTGFNAGLHVDNSHFRRIEQGAIGIASGSATITATRIDSAGTGIGSTYGVLTIRGTDVRHVATGISSGRGVLSLDGVRIEGAAYVGVGLGNVSQPSRLTGARDVIVRGGAGRPFVGTAQDASTLSDPGLDNSIAGNANDTIVISRYNEAAGDIVIRSGLHWIAPEGLSLTGTGALRLEPGTSLTVASSTFGLSLGLPIVARGTTAAPVTLIALGTQPDRRRSRHGGGPAGSDTIVHAVVRGMILVSDTIRPMHIDSSTVLDGGGVILRAPGSRVLATTVADPADSAGIVLAASGVSVHDVNVSGALGLGIRIDAAGAGISGCTITGSAGDGILVRAATGVTIHDCNLQDNGGPGVRNVDAPAVDARFNWWGDPAGPLGPDGDGVEGPVQIAPFRIMPAPTAGPQPSPTARRQ